MSTVSKSHRNGIPSGVRNRLARACAAVMAETEKASVEMFEYVPASVSATNVRPDGDLLRELLDKNRITKYDWEDDVCRPLMIFDGTDSNNGTKSNPCLQGDIIGDWREEVLLRTEDNSALRLYVSRIPTEYRFHTFLEDPVYRISIATQNVAYNQPTQPGFYFGPDLKEGIFRGYEFKNE